MLEIIVQHSNVTQVTFAVCLERPTPMCLQEHCGIALELIVPSDRGSTIFYFIPAQC